MYERDNMAKRWGFSSIKKANEYLHAENKKWDKTLQKIPSKDLPISPGKQHEKKIIGAFRSQDYIVQMFDESHKIPGMLRLSVNRTILQKRTGHWAEDITWEQLQEIKDELGYEDRDAVEVYPRKEDVVNVAPIRHLWIMPELLSWAWRGE